MTQTLSVASDRASTSEVVVRPASPTEWVLVRETCLWALLAEGGTPLLSFSDAVRETGTKWLTRLTFDPWALALVDGEVVGVAGRVGIDGDGVVMWVAPAWRGHGIGRLLAREVEPTSQASAALSSP